MTVIANDTLNKCRQSEIGPNEVTPFNKTFPTGDKARFISDYPADLHRRQVSQSGMAPRRSARQKRAADDQTPLRSSGESQASSMEASDFSETERCPSLGRIVDSIAMLIDTPAPQLPPPPPPQLGSTNKKRGRGPTRLLTLARLAPGQKFHLDWDEQNNPIGIHAAEFASYCGYVVRCEENIPLTVKAWRDVPDESIKKSLEAVMKIFDFEQTDERLDYIYHDFSIKFRNYRSRLRKDHYLPYESDSERLAHPPENVSMDAWKWLVNYWGTDRYSEMSKKNRDSRSKHQMNHCSARKSYARVIDEDTRATGKRPNRMRVYSITHRQNIGVSVKKDPEETINEGKDFTQPSDGPDAQPFSDEEAFDILYPPGRNGRPKCTPRKSTFQRAGTPNTQSPLVINALQTELEDTRATLQATQTQLHEALSTLEATRLKVNQHEEKHLHHEEKHLQHEEKLVQQAKEIDELQGQVGRLYSMMLTLRGD